MKLLSYQDATNLKLGCVWNQDTLLDLNKVYQQYQTSGLKDTSSTAKLIPSDMLTFLQTWDQTWPAAHAAYRWLIGTNDDVLIQKVTVPLKEVRITAPISNPSKVICVGLNYRDHCREHHYPIPERPLIFSKFPSSIIGPYDAVCWSKTNSHEVDYEAELALVIKKTCRNISPAEAPEYIGGYCVLNDISARDVQFSDKQWTRGKSFDTFCPYGPYLTTPDEVPDPQNLWIRCTLNDQVVQNSSTAEMVFSCYEIISFISQVATLLPGDLIATGTPDGVGSARDPQIYLKNGDTIRVEIEGLGQIVNPINEMD